MAVFVSGSIHNRENRRSWTENERILVLGELSRKGLSVPRLSEYISNQYGLEVPPPTIYKWKDGRRAKIKCLQIPDNLEKRSEFWYLIGVLHGDGCVSSNSKHRCFSIAVKDIDYLEHLRKTVFSLFDYLPHIKYRPDCNYIEIFPKRVVDIFAKYKSARAWDIPRAISSKKEEIVASYLRGLFDTDGHVSFRRRNDRYGRIDRGIFLNIDNRIACKGIHRLLESMGILSRYYHIKYMKGKRRYEIDRIAIKNQKCVRRFSRVIGFSHPRKKEILRTVLEESSGLVEKHFDTKNMIMCILKRGELSTHGICNILKRENSTIKEHLVYLEKKGRVARRTECFNRWGVCKKSLYKRCMWRMS